MVPINSQPGKPLFVYSLKRVPYHGISQLIFGTGETVLDKSEI
jgi:hypothetical protein